MYKHDVLASNIKKYRIKSGLTQTELAEKLFVSSQAISKWERGQTIPDLTNLCTLAEIFQITVDNLIGITKEKFAQNVFIGIDGGGTKTQFIMFSEDGHILKTINLLEGSNPNSCGIEKCIDILKRGVDTLLDFYSEVKGLFCGIAGGSSEDNRHHIYEFFKRTYPDLNVNINSDIINVMSCVPQLDDCIAAICGTGFSVFAKVDGEIHRIGGWGYLLDKNGSGFDLGRDALRAALAQEDGFGEKTLITDFVRARLGSKVFDNIAQIYSGGNSYIASFAPIVFSAYEKGDKVAGKILCENADRIVFLIECAVKLYSCNDVIISGGMCGEDSVLTKLIRKKLSGGINLISPKLPQIFGACVKCCKLYGNFTDKFTENFTKDYK